MNSPAITILLILVFLILVVAATLIFLKNYLMKVPTVKEASDLNWYIRKAEQWEFQARILRTSQVALAGLAIIASVLSASQWKPKFLPDGLLAVLAAISIALLTGLDLSSQANKMRKAERHLTFAILESKQAPNPQYDKLLKAFQEAENIIGDYSPQVGSK
jgi:hypothetical protein